MFQETKILNMTTGDTEVTSTYRYIVSILFNPGTDASTLTITDDLTSGGAEMVKLVSPANGQSIAYTPCMPIKFDTGIHIAVTGTAANVKVQVM